MAETAAPPRSAEHLDRGAGYEDFVLWTERQATLIPCPPRSGRLGEHGRREVAELSREEYPAARKAASAEAGFALGTFPKALPDTAEQILDEDFLPGPVDEKS